MTDANSIVSWWIKIVICLVSIVPAHGAVPFKKDWRQSGIAPALVSFEIRGTGNRNNPIRRELKEPFEGEELFAKFRVRYAADSIDQPGEGNGEFFVFWFDVAEGGDTATHSSGIPNIGIHVAGDKNRFMVRYSSRQEKFTKTELMGDREYQIVGRLWKTKPGAVEPFDALDIWVDPEFEAEFKPHASTKSAKSISEVNWIGFSTGAKTETSDRIYVAGIELADNWEEIMGLPPKVDQTDVYKPKPPPVVKKTVAFREHIFPILKENCFKCHEGRKAKGGVRLDVWDEAMNQTTPRNGDASHLIDLVTTTDPDKRMPPKGARLAAKSVDRLKAWINEGLEWDEELLPTPTPKTDHWAFQPIRRPSVPERKWGRNAVDAFIGRKLTEHGLKPAPEADDGTLRRRLWLDLIGTPPAGDAARVDELLASKHYGERWGRHWLDVARWAESNGHQHNRDRPHAWRYRDYVINAFNRDKPFDDFLSEQIAGDELPFKTERVIATGFMAAARYSGNELDKDIQRNDILVDVVNTTSAAFLGLTFECAQCHTHKFDPISIRDYYGLQAFFVQGQPNNLVLDRDNELRRLIARRQQIFDGVHARIVRMKRKQGHPEPILVIPKTVVGGMRPEERKQYDELGKRIDKAPQVWGFYSPITSTNRIDVAPHEMRWPLPSHPKSLEYTKAHLLVRGDVQSKGPEIKPALPAVFKTATKAHNRLGLADWLTGPDNPLTARVWVNRIWQWHFGRGLVETSNDFGKHGTMPTHPELLDWLATELVNNGWSTKHIHRLILNSATYRQSSAWSAGNAEIDPENRYLWRWQPRRLEAEALRDSMLATAGLLDRKMAGPSVGLKAAETSDRRSIYLQQKRDNLPHQQTLFDSSSAVVSCSRRATSTVASQPLFLLNSGFSQRVSEAFAKRVWRKDSRAKEQARLAIELALGRNATDDEIAKSAELISSDGLVKFCQALLNLNEFVYIP